MHMVRQYGVETELSLLQINRRGSTDKCLKRTIGKRSTIRHPAFLIWRRPLSAPAGRSPLLLQLLLPCVAGQSQQHTSEHRECCELAVADGEVSLATISRPLPPSSIRDSSSDPSHTTRRLPDLACLESLTTSATISAYHDLLVYQWQQDALAGTTCATMPSSSYGFGVHATWRH